MLALEEVKTFLVLSQDSHTVEAQHCVRNYQAWEEQGHLFIQMELCDRGASTPNKTACRPVFTEALVDVMQEHCSSTSSSLARLSMKPPSERSLLTSHRCQSDLMDDATAKLLPLCATCLSAGLVACAQPPPHAPRCQARQLFPGRSGHAQTWRLWHRSAGLWFRLAMTR